MRAKSAVRGESRAERGASQTPKPELDLPMTFRWTRSGSVLLAVVLVAAVVVGAPSVREWGLRAAGRALVAEEPLKPADVIVISSHSAGAGALEAADLVHSGIARRVAVFADPPDGEDLEFIRRGLPYDDAAARQVRQLERLGVTEIMQISGKEAGTDGEGRMLPSWCDQHAFRSVVFVAARNHSRRTQRVLDRLMKGHPTRVTVRAERYSGFDPDRWWQTRGGARAELVEFQKLVLDVVLHPLSF
jgi:hypothetical protein